MSYAPEPPWRWYEKFIIAILCGFVWALMFVLAASIVRAVLP